MTDQEQQDKRLDKIRKILAKAERTNNPEEAKTFTAAAQKLMTEWAIDEAMLQATDAGVDTDRMVTKTIDLDYSPYLKPHDMLVKALCDTNSCQVFHVKTYDFSRTNKSGGRQQVSRLHIFGFERDVDFVIMLYTSLALQQEIEFRTPEVQFRMQMETSHPGHRIKWRNSFNIGYVAAIRKRLETAKADAVQEADGRTPGTALVLANRAQLVKAVFDSQNRKLRKTGNKAGGYDGGLEAGFQAGQRADVGHAKVGQGVKGELR